MMEKLTPHVGDKSFSLPKPRLCHHCKERKKLMFRNEGSYYRRKCDKCGKSIVSVSHADYKRSPLYCYDCWWGDEFDATEYGQDIDREKPITDQLLSLASRTPQLALAQ